MEEFIKLSTQLHLFFIGILVILACVNIYFLKREGPFSKLSYAVQRITPQYFVILSTIFFTGIIVMAVNQFVVTASVWVMVVVWVFILVQSIKGRKMYKKLNKTNQTEQAVYKQSAIQKYLVDLVLIIVVIAFSYLAH